MRAFRDIQDIGPFIAWWRQTCLRLDDIRSRPQGDSVWPQTAKGSYSRSTQHRWLGVGKHIEEFLIATRRCREELNRVHSVLLISAPNSNVSSSGICYIPLISAYSISWFEQTCLTPSGSAHHEQSSPTILTENRTLQGSMTTIPVSPGRGSKLKFSFVRVTQSRQRSQSCDASRWNKSRRVSLAGLCAYVNF
ncbi:hypothetical protein L208DRAFT_630526 [Tricholoma matsutake]|nr:hypothetical protein L208DRAFT_630526 [Tricholoma matsutake 945]